MSLSERVAEKQNQKVSTPAEEAKPVEPPPVPKLTERPASDIDYVKFFNFTISIGPGTQGQAYRGEAEFMWSARGTLLIRDRANGNEFEFHPSQFTAYYKPVKGWRREAPSVS